MSNSDLCQRCHEIDFDRILQGRFGTSRDRPYLVSHLGSVLEAQRQSSCPFCRLIAEAVYRPFCDEGLADFHDSLLQKGAHPLTNLVAGSSIKKPHAKEFALFAQVVDAGPTQDVMRMFDDIRNYHQRDRLRLAKFGREFTNADTMTRTAGTTFVSLKIGQLESGGIVFYHGSIFAGYDVPGKPAPARILDPSDIDWTLPRSWLKTCQEEHRMCASPNLIPRIDGFSLIDCTTRRVQPASEGQIYAAVTYVWGEPEKTSRPGSAWRFSPGVVLPKVELVIEDAITTVCRMGLQYLWVDR